MPSVRRFWFRMGGFFECQKAKDYAIGWFDGPRIYLQSPVPLLIFSFSTQMAEHRFELWVLLLARCHPSGWIRFQTRPKSCESLSISAQFWILPFSTIRISTNSRIHFRTTIFLLRLERLERVGTPFQPYFPPSGWFNLCVTHSYIYIYFILKYIYIRRLDWLERLERKWCRCFQEKAYYERGSPRFFRENPGYFSKFWKNTKTLV